MDTMIFIPLAERILKLLGYMTREEIHDLVIADCDGDEALFQFAYQAAHCLLPKEETTR